MSEYDNIGVQYILDNYNLNALKQMDDEELYQLVYETCDMLSWANEECDFGTFGENYAHDVNAQKVYDYIVNLKNERN